MRKLGYFLGALLYFSLAGFAGASDDSGMVGDGVTGQYTNLSPDGRERLLFEEQAAKAGLRARQRMPFTQEELLAIVSEAALRNGIEPELLCAMAWAESRFRPYAVSPMGALGLMQLMPSTARRFGVKNPMNPVESAEGGARYMRILLDMYENDSVLALAAYNVGEGAVRPGRRLPPNSPAVGFVRSVLAQREFYRNQEP